MCEIIPFPNNKSIKVNNQFAVEQIEPTGYIPVKKIDFTCPSCQTQTSFSFNNIIFRNLQFYCSKCGAGWKVTNKLFATAIDKDNKARNYDTSSDK
jgi:transposase-like protein